MVRQENVLEHHVKLILMKGLLLFFLRSGIVEIRVTVIPKPFSGFPDDRGPNRKMAKKFSFKGVDGCIGSREF